MHEPPDWKERQHAKQINIEKDDQKSKQQKAEKEKQLKKEKKYKKTNHILTRLVELLKASYSKNPFIERLFYPDNPLLLEQCYLHLALTQEIKVKTSNAEKESNKEKERIREEADEATHERSDRKNKERIIGDNPHDFSLRQYERIETIQRKIEVKDLLSVAKETPKHIYIEGIAGSGKSTLSRYIVYQWCLDKAPWNQYQWVFYMRLRELSDSKYTENKMQFLEVIQRECFMLGLNNSLTQEEQKLLQKILRKHPNQVLFVLDGLDELQSNNYTQAFWDDLIHSSHDLLITSRFGVQVNKRELRISLNLAVLGFSDEQVKHYINNFFDPETTPEVKREDGQNCLNLLQTHANLWSLAHTPIQLELLCSIWGEEFKQHQNDINLTYLYRLIFEKLLKRSEQLYLFKQKRKTVSLNNIDIKPLKAKWQNHIKYMEYLAFLGMKKKVIILQAQDMNEAYRILPSTPTDADEFYQQLRELGLIKRYNDGKQAEFIHLTFQEFFAAKYIGRTIKTFCEGKIEGLNHGALLEFICKSKWDLFYEVMWWILAGILVGKRIQRQELEMYRYQYQTNEKDIELKLPKSHIRLQRLQAFFDLLLQEPRNPIRYEELLLLARCLDEARMPEIMQKETISKHIFYYYTHYIGDYRYEFITQFEKIKIFIKLNRIFIKSNREMFEKFMLEKLKEHGVRLIELIKLFPEKALPLLLDELKSSDKYRRSMAIKTLGKLRSKDELILVILEALQDQHENVRSAATNALAELGNQASEQVINALLVVSKDQHEDVRRAAAYALAKIGNQGSEEIIVALQGALKDDKLGVRRAAAEALGKLGNQAPNKVIPVLREILKDNNENARRAAAFSLRYIGSIGSKTITEALLERLSDDPNEHVRSTAIFSLIERDVIDSENVIPILQELFTDKESPVHITAAIALVKLGGQNQEKVIPALLEALNGKEDGMRRAAAKALGELGNQAEEKVMLALLEALKEDEEFLRCAAAKALGKLGGQGQEKVISALLEALKDDEEFLRYAAAKALGKLGGQGQEKVISALLKALNAKEDDVCSAAAKALAKITSVSQNRINFYLDQILNGSFMPQDAEARKKIIILLLKEIKTVPLTFLNFSINELFSRQPPSIPPSRLIGSSKDIAKVNDKGKLLTLTLCSEVMESIIKNNQETHVINQDFWTISIVRKREGARNDNTSPGFFKSIKFTNGLFDHAFIIIEGVYQSVRFAKKIDLYAEKSKSSQSSEQRTRIEVADIDDFKRLEKLAANCSCMVQGISRQKAEQLEKIIKRNQAAAERGEIIYNIKGDGSFSNSNRDRKEHSCISWCLEKWQEIGLPLQRKWYDAIVVVPKAYLPEPEPKDEKCLTM